MEETRILVTSSFEKQISLSNYGGKQYETERYYCSAQTYAAPSDTKRMIKVLDNLCQAAVGEAIMERLDKLQVNITNP